MIVSFYRRGAACFSARKLFCGTLFAKGGGHLIPLYAPLRVAALIKILLFGPITHHAVIVTLACFLVVTRGRDLFVISNTQCAGRFFGMGDTPFVRKTRLVRKVMTVQNCSMKGLPMRRALTTGVVRRSNICGPASSRGRAILLRVQMGMGVSSQNSTLRRTERG
jgi:hypothetical protein